MTSLKIRKIGNSVGVILSKEVQEVLNISEGDYIDVISIGNNKVILESRLPHHSQWTFKDTNLNKEDQKWTEADLEDDHEKTTQW